jgi:hypothetical protein
MSNIPISSLPIAISIDGSEYVPAVQGGTTKRFTTQQIASLAGTGTGSTAPFVMASDFHLAFPNSRALAAQAGVTTVTDAGAGTTLTVGIATNGIGNTQFRQSTARSVVGNATNALANVADISGTANQVLRVNGAGTALAFGAIDLSQSTAVGANTITLAGPLATSGAFSSTFTMTGITAVTFPTSGTLATTSGASIPAVAQGDLLYGSGVNTLTTLAKNATATRYLSNTGASNNPAWAQVNLANGVTGNLPVANLNSGTSASSTTFWRGDGAWAAPVGTVSTTGSPTVNQFATFSSATVIQGVSITGLVKGNGASAPTAAVSGTDYAPATSGSAILKGNGAGGFSSAVAGTDYLAPAAIGVTVQAFDAQLFSTIPQNSQSTAYTLVLTDGEKHIFHPSSDNNARTYTIPANASVAYPIGTTVTFVNKINTVTIAINTDTLTQAGSGSTGSRTLAANGMATAIKIATTEWMISGSGLT